MDRIDTWSVVKVENSESEDGRSLYRINKNGHLSRMRNGTDEEARFTLERSVNATRSALKRHGHVIKEEYWQGEEYWLISDEDPNQMGARQIYIDDARWDAAVEYAKKRGINSASEVIRNALDEYI